MVNPCLTINDIYGLLCCLNCGRDCQFYSTTHTVNFYITPADICRNNCCLLNLNYRRLRSDRVRSGSPNSSSLNSANLLKAGVKVEFTGLRGFLCKVRWKLIVRFHLGVKNRQRYCPCFAKWSALGFAEQPSHQKWMLKPWRIPLGFTARLWSIVVFPHSTTT